MEDKELVNIEETKTSDWDTALENENWIAPVVDIYETEDDFILVANMPGIKKENVKIKIEDGSLLIMGRVEFDNLVNRNYIMNESQIGNFYRKFQISESIDDSKIEAKLENGQLIAHLPKHERAKPKNIEIK
jgi:HSP20 family protein